MRTQDASLLVSASDLVTVSDSFCPSKHMNTCRLLHQDET